MVQGGVSVFLGPDRDRKRERVEALTKDLAIHLLDRHELNAAHLSAETLLAHAREHPVASPLRLLVIHEAQRLDTACLNVLAAQGDVLRQTAAIVLLIDNDLGANHVVTALKGHAVIEPFAWRSPQEVNQWIIRYVAGQRKRIAASALHELVQGYGADLGGIRLLLDQVITWVGTRPELTLEDLRLFVRVPPARRRFALIEAIARRDVAAALRVVHEHQLEGDDVVELIGLLAWQLHRWLTVGHLVQAGVSPERIMTLTDLQTWQLEKTSAELASRPLGVLRGFLRKCWELDVGAKSGKTIPRVALEQLIVELCLPRAVPTICTE